MSHKNIATEPCDLSAVEQQRLIRAGELSARELLDSSLRRIAEVNPAVNAIVSLTADEARHAAAAADERQAAGEELPLLHGLPIAHKDLLRTRGLRTTMGSRLFASQVPTADDAVAARLAAAGTVRLGKTNVPEFGFGSHSVNPVFGATRNPYDTTRGAGGSSGGAAAALATGMLSIADGGDMGGSLRNPASFNGVVGLRPSVGRVSTAPRSSAAHSLAVLGPMARTVADTALLFAAMAGFDPADGSSLPGDGTEFLAVAFEEPAADLAGVRVAFTPDLGGLPFDAEVLRVFREVGLPALEAAGASLEEWTPDFSGAVEAFRHPRAWGVFSMLGGAEVPAELLGENARAEIALGREVTARQLAEAHTAQERIRRRTLDVFDRAEVIVAPVSQVPPFPVEWDWPHTVGGTPMETYLDWMSSCWYFTVTGLPAMSIPCGFTTTGLPVGIQLIGRPAGELSLLRFAATLERYLPHGALPPRTLSERLERA